MARGFASLTPERRRELARKGGQAAMASGNGHRFTKEEAIAAGRKGGQAVAQRDGHMRALSKLGVQRRKQQREGGHDD